MTPWRSHHESNASFICQCHSNQFAPCAVPFGHRRCLDHHLQRSHALAGRAVGLLLPLLLALLWVGIFFGLRASGPESVTSVDVLAWPLRFLSNAFVDASTMPPWLGAIAQCNPLSASPSAIPQLFLKP